MKQFSYTIDIVSVLTFIANAQINYSEYEY